MSALIETKEAGFFHRQKKTTGPLRIQEPHIYTQNNITIFVKKFTPVFCYHSLNKFKPTQQKIIRLYTRLQTQSSLLRSQKNFIFNKQVEDLIKDSKLKKVFLSATVQGNSMQKHQDQRANPIFLPSTQSPFCYRHLCS